MQQIEIGDLFIYVVRKSIKNIHLSVYPPNGSVRIAVPLNTDEDTIKLFIISKLAWIKRNRRKFENQERQSERVYLDRETHYFLGKKYLLKLIEENSKPKIEIRNKNILLLYARPNSSTKQRDEIINKWYRNYLSKEIPQIVKKWEAIIGVTVENWEIRKMKTKWGTCNIEKKEIRINLELAKKSKGCLEFIVVHEMVHLLERHHNTQFICYMDRFLPNWKNLKEELNSLPLNHIDWNY